MGMPRTTRPGCGVVSGVSSFVGSSLFRASIEFAWCRRTLHTYRPTDCSVVWVVEKTLSGTHLSHLQYTVLGLGDTNYSQFCYMGKEFHKRRVVAPLRCPNFSPDTVFIATMSATCGARMCITSTGWVSLERRASIHLVSPTTVLGESRRFRHLNCAIIPCEYKIVISRNH